eukprot:CAMPEP_0184008202 /NCGR_PEP_ID=MMETSP0954-20121128/1821_1 /TAXON_ID=627963 /ORGANISM="Aplanochytrium sp, Strain PBS07" /LENGTH=1073 /DNA_ID=CAMNT_0026287243 /DNA_START=76 /DNA_END=3297 /DNA_ORIENTATION=-
MESDSDEELGVLASGFSFQNIEEPEDDRETKGKEGSGYKPSLPFFSLSEVEVLVVESNVEALNVLRENVQQMVDSELIDKPERNHSTALLQLEIISIASNVAAGEYFKVLESPLIAPLLARYETRDRSFRIKNRVDRYMVAEVMTFIKEGLSAKIENCPENSLPSQTKDERGGEINYVSFQGDLDFKEPNMAGPDVHVSQRVLRAAAVMFAGAALLGLYQQANWTGPPLNDEKVEKLYPLPFVQDIFDNVTKEKSYTEDEKKAIEKAKADAKASSAISGKKVDSFNLDKYPKLHVYTGKKLEANGEPVYRDAKYIHYLHVARVLLRSITKPTLKASAVDPDDFLPAEALEAGAPGAAKPKPKPEKVPAEIRLAQTANWWASRSSCCHHETMERHKANDPSLKLEMDQCFEKTLKNKIVLSGQYKNLEARLYLEWGICCHKFDDPEGAKRSFQKAREASGLEVSLSGALGKRTKFQTESKSQLVLLAKSSTTKVDTNESPSDDEDDVVENGDLEKDTNDEELDPNDPEASMVGKTKVLGIRTIRLKELDEYTPLREKIKFTDDEADALERKGRLSEIDQAIVLGLCVDVKNSYAMENLTYVQRVMQHPQNWMIYSTALFLKSNLEYESTKTKDRAVLQMQLLVDQQSDRLTPLQATAKEIEDSAPVFERMKWLRGLAWPALWNLKRHLALKYLSMGVVKSALQICEEVFLWEEAVDCLLAMGAKARAIKLVNERLEISPTSNLYCQMGILTQEIDWFEKAWEFSGRRYSRAKRLWARASFELGDYKSSISHFEDALKINPLKPYAWLRLGVAAMRLEDWRTAKRAFIQVTSQEPTDGEAWANLCAVYDKMDQPKAALNAICEAVKYQRNSWKIWENYLTFTLREKEWSLALDALNSLIDLRVGLGGKSNKDGEVDVQALVVIVEALVSENQMAHLIPPDETKIAGTDERSIAIKKNNFLRRKLGTLFRRIKAECKSDANVWKIFSVYFKCFKDRESYRDCLIRRVRALQVPDWERDESKAGRVCKAVIETVKAYRQDSESLPSLKAQATNLLETTIERVEEFPELVASLQVISS